MASLSPILYRTRHALGAVAALTTAWFPFLRGMVAYEPISTHGECGFLCIFLVVAVYWWLVAAIAGAFMWFAVASLLRLARPDPSP